MSASWSGGPRDRTSVHRFRLAWLLTILTFAVSIGAGLASAAEPAGDRPNVVVILADDVGYGDLGCYGATKVKTPHLDRLAGDGRRFTDAHSPSSVCTPTRYALLTGQYAWRQAGGLGHPQRRRALCIRTSQFTLPRVFKSAGYATGAIGKWHLGLGGDGQEKRPARSRPTTTRRSSPARSNSASITSSASRPPAIARRASTSRITRWSATTRPIRSRVSYGTPIGNEPTGKDHPELLKVKPSHGHDNTIVNGISRIGYMSGGKAARWVDEDMADVLTRQGGAVHRIASPASPSSCTFARTTSTCRACRTRGSPARANTALAAT